MQPLLALLYDRIICYYQPTTGEYKCKMQPLLALLYDRIICYYQPTTGEYKCNHCLLCYMIE